MRLHAFSFAVSAVLVVGFSWPRPTKNTGCAGDVLRHEARNPTLFSSGEDVAKHHGSELIDSDGYGMIMKYQLYPWTHKELAKRVADELTLPVDAPRALYEVTMNRFLEWHKKWL